MNIDITDKHSHKVDIGLAVAMHLSGFSESKFESHSYSLQSVLFASSTETYLTIKFFGKQSVISREEL